MARGANQKLKMYYLVNILLENTDEDHGLTMSEIIEELNARDISAERKSVYSDIADITDKIGIEVISEKYGRDTFYKIIDRGFELAEVKLLIDAVLSSKFITKRKSKELIDKIKTLVSKYEAKQLERQVYISDRAKTMNESVFYNVDDIHDAINENRKIKFKYYRYDIDKSLVARHGGEFFVVSPWALMWDDEKYYLIAYDGWDSSIKNYRVDKMKYISIIDERREGYNEFKQIDLSSYSMTRFAMYNGELKQVKIELRNDLCSVFIDRFGQDIDFIPIDYARSYVLVDVAISDQFFGWLFGLGEGVKLLGPDDVVDKLKTMANSFSQRYQ